MNRFPGLVLGIASSLLWIQYAACFAVRSHPAAVSSTHRTSALRSRFDRRVARGGLEMLQRRHKGCCASRDSMGSRSREGSRGSARSTMLKISEEDRERDLKFEQDLDRDAQLWVQGDPEKQKLWEKAKAWRNLNKMLLAREEAMSELERDRLRYILKEAQTVTGLPLVDGKEITPLAWCITLTIQLMPLASFYIIFSTLMMEHDPQPVLDASRPFWA
ncbi:unnamed protein product [Scytosiphon promiscuus]